MSGYRCVNYYELCRLCTASQGGKIHIFSEEGRKRNLYNKITECLPIVVDENDKLPKIVCTMCVEQIDTISEFREGCINAQTMLDSCLNSSKLRNGGKVYIKDSCTTKKTVVNPTTLNIIKTVPSTINISTTGAQQQQTTNLVTNPDFLSSIIQAVGIQSMDDSQQDVLQQQQQQPQYTLTLDGQTIKANQIQYKIEEPTTYVISEAPQQMTQQQHQQQQQLSQIDEFLKLNTTKKIVTTPLTTTLKRDLNTDLGNKTDYSNKGGTTQIISSGGGNSGISYTGTTTASSQLQTLQQNMSANKKSKINLLLTTSPQKTTVATAATQKNTLQIQDLKFFPPNKCYVPITLKQDSSTVTNSIANLGTNTSSISCVNQKGEQQILPTTYLQMKLEPFQLSATGGLPTTLSIAPVTQHQQLQQHQNNHSTTTSQSIPVHSVAQPQHHNNLLQHQNSINTMTTVVSNIGQHQQTHSQNTNQQQQQQTVQLQLTTIPTSLANNIQQYSNKASTVLQQQTIQATTIKQIVQQKQIGNTTINKVVSVTNAKPNLAVIQQQQAAQQQQQQQQQQLQQQQQQLQQHHDQPVTTAISSIVAPVVTKSSKKFATSTVVSVTPPNSTTTESDTTSAITPTKTDIASTAVVVSTTATTPTTSTTATGTPGTPAQSVTVCELCKKQFKRKEHLMQHLKLHAGLRPFKCEKPDCNKSFSRKEHLLRHVISHTGKKLFNCDLCQKLFSRKDNLNKHRKTHPEAGAQNGPYYCEICQKSFAVKLYYVQHKAMHDKEGSAENITDTVIKQESQQHEQEIHSHILLNTEQQQELMELQLPTIGSSNTNNNIGDVMAELKSIDKNGTVT